MTTAAGFRWSLFLWVSIVLGLALAGHAQSPPPAQRTLFSDQAAHIAAALSIWHDRDLEYTLDDLARFRQAVPAEPGPKGAFLKTGTDGGLHYAKPFLYAAAAAPFVAAFGTDGFRVFNVLCLLALGIVALHALAPHFGNLNALLLTGGILLPSPFLAWTPVAHPELFIAALPVLGGALLLKRGLAPGWRIAGALLLGLVLYEKPPFVFLVAPIFLAMYRGISPRFLALLLAVTVAGWLAPTMVNLLQDGNLLAYKGQRFYVQGVRGTFPLEAGWKGLPATGDTERIFARGAVTEALSQNLPLLPAKLADSLLGRQTGMLFYFPVALLLLGLLLAALSWRRAAILLGLFAYLAFNWLLFPTNGYGGAGTYGPRYTMQALGILFVAFLLPPRAGPASAAPSRRATVPIVVAVAIAAVLQHRVLPPRYDLVGEPDWIFSSPVAALFPVESILAPTIASTAPPAFNREDGRDNHLYVLDGTGEDFHLDLGAGSAGRDIVLIQNEAAIARGLSFPPIGIRVTRAMAIELLAGDRPVGRATVHPGGRHWLSIENPFGKPISDARLGRFRMARLAVRARPVGGEHPGVPSWVDFALKEGGQETGCLATPGRLADKGVRLLVGWQCPEDWGVWSRGGYAALSVRVPSAGRMPRMEFEVQAFTPAAAPSLTVEVTANGALLDTWSFRHGEPASPRILRLPPELKGDGREIILGFRLHEPRSPAEVGVGTDPREIGLGLVDLRFSSE